MNTVPAADLLNKALQRLNAGEPGSAEALCLEVITQLPDASDALHIMGLCAFEQKRHADAADFLLKSLSANPEEPGVWQHLGMTYEAVGKLPDAIDAYQHALAVGDNNAVLPLSRTLCQADRIDEAIALWKQRLIELPEDTNAWLVLGKILLDANRLAEAEAHYRAAVEIKPDFFDTWICLGNTLRGLGRPDDAASAYRQALKLEPNSALCLANLGTTFLDRGEFDQALPWYDRAIAANPDYATARVLRCVTELPMFYNNSAEVELVRSRYLDALEGLVRHYTVVAPENLPKLGQVIGHTQPFLLPYQQRNDREAQARYGDLMCRAANAAYSRYAVTSAHRPAPPDKGRLRIAIIGAHFCGHSVWKAITRGWVEQLDRRKYALYGYHTSPKVDTQTGYAKRLFHRFVQGPLDAEEWMRRIREDDPHLIIYPELGMDPMTAKLAAVRLAPVQCVAWGHPETTGYPTLDYYLSGELLDSPESGEHYTEQLVRLAGTSSHYTPLTVPEAQVNRFDFGVGDDEVAYLCCQNLL